MRSECLSDHLSWRGVLHKPAMMSPEPARMVIEAYTAADICAERNEPVDLPLSNASVSAIVDLAGSET